MAPGPAWPGASLGAGSAAAGSAGQAAGGPERLVKAGPFPQHLTGLFSSWENHVDEQTRFDRTVSKRCRGAHRSSARWDRCSTSTAGTRRGRAAGWAAPSLPRAPNAPSAPQTAPAGDTKGFALLRAAAVSLYQGLDVKDEARWVLNRNPSPLFFSLQLFIKAQRKGPDARPAGSSSRDLCDTSG